ncbi:MAG: type II secretion system F family protein [Propionibacteriaceae bacterium]
MKALAAGLYAALLGSGIIAVMCGLRPTRTPLHVFKPAQRLVQWRRYIDLWTGLSIIAGFVIWWLTSLPIAVIAVPALYAVGRWLLATPPHAEIAMLESLDRWVRALAATVAAGRSVAEAIRISRRTAPTLLSPAVTLAVQRIDERWSVRDALFAMADQLASPHVDTVLASLILAHERGGTGLSTSLVALADGVQEQLTSWRAIEAEREKPRVVVRQVTWLSLLVLGVGMTIGRGYFAPYRTGLGQLLLAGLLTIYVLALIWLRRMTIPRTRQRILQHGGSDAE